MIDKIDQSSTFVTKAASQCILSMCKLEGIRQIVKSLDEARIRKIKILLEDVVEKMSSSTFFITPLDLEGLLKTPDNMKV